MSSEDDCDDTFILQDDRLPKLEDDPLLLPTDDTSMPSISDALAVLLQQTGAVEVSWRAWSVLKLILIVDTSDARQA